MFEDQNTIETPTVRPTATDTDRFRQEVMVGLSMPQKRLPSKYFYDAQGDRLYNSIMSTDEYYLSGSEMEIFSQRTDELLSILTGKYDRFSLVELGPGDVRKSIHLISALHMDRIRFEYVPIDISKNVILSLSSSLPGCFKDLPIHPMHGEYLEMLQSYNATNPNVPKVVLCLGGNIANMLPAETEDFCTQLRMNLNVGDLAILGFDLRKNPHVIRAAYNDRAGITAAFNLNLLTRMNRELGANFDIAKFDHYCHYDPETGSCKSYLVCLEETDVKIDNFRVHFETNECIWMEVSQKYSRDEISKMAATANFSVVKNIYDNREWFTDSIWVAR